jgi:hypothetical protein
VQGYARNSVYTPGAVTLAADQDAEVNLALSSEAPGTVSGSINVVNPGDGTVFLAVSHRQPGNITVRFAQTVLAMSAGATASLVPGEPHGLCLRRSQGKVTVQQPRHPTAGGNRNTVDKQHAVTRHQPVPPRRTADRYRRTFIDKD